MSEQKTHGTPYMPVEAVMEGLKEEVAKLRATIENAGQWAAPVFIEVDDRGSVHLVNTREIKQVMLKDDHKLVIMHDGQRVKAPDGCGLARGLSRTSVIQWQTEESMRKWLGRCEGAGEEDDE